MKRFLFILTMGVFVLGSLALVATAAGGGRAHTVFAEGGFPTG